MGDTAKRKGRPLITDDEIIETVHRDIVELRSLWAIELELFRRPDVIALLNGTAPSFFAFLRDQLTHGVVLKVHRLLETNPKRVTLHRLREVVARRHPSVDLSDIASDLAEEEVTRTLAKVRDWRHRFLAHREELLAASEAAQREIALGHVEVDQVIDAITNTAEELRTLVTGRQELYHACPAPGAYDLLRALERARGVGHAVEADQ